MMRALLLLTTVLFLVLVSTFQVTAQPAVKWRYFDSTEHEFRIGAVSLSLPRIARGLGIDFTRLYSMPNAGDLMRQVNAPCSILDSTAARLWLQGDTVGFKVVAPTPRATRATSAGKLVEYYFSAKDDIQWLDFEYKPADSILVAGKDTTMMHNLVQGVTVRQRNSSVEPPLFFAGGASLHRRSNFLWRLYICVTQLVQTSEILPVCHPRFRGDDNCGLQWYVIAFSLSVIAGSTTLSVGRMDGRSLGSG